MVIPPSTILILCIVFLGVGTWGTSPYGQRVLTPMGVLLFSLVWWFSLLGAAGAVLMMGLKP